MSDEVKKVATLAPPITSCFCTRSRLHPHLHCVHRAMQGNEWNGEVLELGRFQVKTERVTGRVNGQV